MIFFYISVYILNGKVVIIMVKVKLVGCNFHPASKNVTQNDVVRLIREPDNKFDKEAIAVINSLGEKIGYVGTHKTVSRGNRRNGCIDNHQLGNIIGSQANGVVKKMKEYFGFIEVDI